MFYFIAFIVVALLLLVLGLSLRIVKQYEQGVLFRFGRVIAVLEPGLRFIIPFTSRPRARLPAPRRCRSPARAS